MTGESTTLSDRTAILPGEDLYEDLLAALDERTHAQLERKRKGPTVGRRGWLIRRMLALADVFGLSAAFLAASAMYASVGPDDRVSLGEEFLLFFLTLPGWIILAKLYGLYERDEERADHSTADDLVGVFHLLTVGTWLFVAGAWLTQLADPSLPKLASFWAFAIVLITLARASVRAFCRRRPAYVQNTVIVGAGEVGQLVARKFLHHPEYGINVFGFVDADPLEPEGESADLPVLGPPHRLPEIVRLFDIERVVIAFSNEPHEQTLDLVRSLKDLDVKVDVVPRLFEIFGPNVGIHTVEGLPLVGLPPFRLSRSALLLKRTLDLALAAVALVLLGPAFVLIAALIRVDSPGPVFFRQTRMGTGGHTFQIRKFRTMVADAEARKAELASLNKHAWKGGDPRMFKVPDDPRTTRVGRLLRRSSLDELPQLLNVVKGEMSLVGPRPLILDEDQHVIEWARHRLDLKPGITGLWQVLGRDDIPFEEMVKLDYLYVTEWSLLNDVKLILRTLPAVVHARNTY